MAVSVRGSFKQLPSGEIVAVLEQSVGIDVTAGIPAPLGEGIRFDVRLEDADAGLGLKLVERLLRGGMPLVKRCMPAALGQKPSERLVVLSGEPGNACSLDLARVIHEALP